jgi:hypothetical protein
VITQAFLDASTRGLRTPTALLNRQHPVRIDVDGIMIVQLREVRRRDVLGGLSHDHPLGPGL